MSDEPEAFPDADHLFQQAFAADDPVPLLLQLVNQHPTYLVVRDLVLNYYTEAVEEDPSRGQILASSLVKLGESPDMPRIETETFSDLVSDELADFHFKVFWGNNEIKEYGPTNRYLLDSLLSGLSLKYGLTSTNNMYAAIDDGLNARRGSDKAEVLVVGACIQLLLHGSEVTNLVGTYRRKAKVVAMKLKAQEAAGIVQDPHAIQLLKLAISHAETGLKPENDRDDVWDLLFPSKS